jgi:FMN phosphatase YigB (HAD superfamily)
MPVQGAIFDLGWTLIRYAGEGGATRRAAHQALVESLVQEGVVQDAESFLGRFHERLQDYDRQRQEDFLEFTMAWVVRRTLSDLGLSAVSDAQLARAVRALYGVIERYWEPRPEAKAVLDELTGMGLRLAILSNAADEGDVRRLIEQCGFDGRFHPILISAARGTQTQPRVFEMVLSSGIPPERAVMIGDTLGQHPVRRMPACTTSARHGSGYARQRGAPDTIHPEFTARLWARSRPSFAASLKLNSTLPGPLAGVESNGSGGRDVEIVLDLRG